MFSKSEELSRFKHTHQIIITESFLFEYLNMVVKTNLYILYES